MKKGFTLIELLAVILILGIIALIAIPTVNNILKEARHGAFSSTINNLNKAIEEKCTLQQIKNEVITTNYTIVNGVISPSLDIKGDLPDGEIFVNSNCEISYILGDNNFVANKEYQNNTKINDISITNFIYTESILNGTDPVLNDNLIPVVINNDGTVKKAKLNSRWYSYEDKLWANAVILKPNGKIENDGTINEDSIESYFVWIPRYKYKLFDMGNYNGEISEKPSSFKRHDIDIVFENKDTETSIGTAVGQYHSHPAFQAFDTNGLWIGKFETTGAIGNLNVKPLQKILSNLNIKTIFEEAYNYKRNNDSHMMKNTEWGAVTYLTLSKYGINKEVNINNYLTPYSTGYSAANQADQSVYPGKSGTKPEETLPYNTEIGYLASTTGNISGIYDMSGGCIEYMASFKDGTLAESGFESDPTIIYGEKYFDKYSSSSSFNKYNYRILGDATGELGPFYYYADEDGNYSRHSNWFRDEAGFIFSYPWFIRGGGIVGGANSGQLAFSSWRGNASSSYSFRLVLSK